MDVGQDNPSLFFKVSWDRCPVSHQKPVQGTWFSQLGLKARYHSYLMAVTRIRPVSDGILRHSMGPQPVHIGGVGVTLM